MADLWLSFMVGTDDCFDITGVIEVGVFTNPVRQCTVSGA